MSKSVSSTTLDRLYAAFCAGDRKTHAETVVTAVRTGETDILSALLAHPLGDEWSDFAHLSLAERWQESAGHLYVVANPVTHRFLKVGKTRLSVAQRLARLNNEAVIGQYECVQSWRVHDRHYLETQAHYALKDAPRFKEHFSLPWRELCPRVAAVVTADRERFEHQGFDLSPYFSARPSFPAPDGAMQ